MRLVRLADLSDEERRKALEEQQTRLNKNRQESQNIQNEANQKFNDYVSQHGAYDTNKHTTTIGDLRKAYRNTPSYNNIKTSTNDLYRNSIWNDVKNTFNNLMVNEKQRNNTYNRGNQSIDQQALEQNNNANFIMQMQNVNKAYRQDQEDKLKGSIAYKQAKLNNPNVSDKELLKIAQNENTKLDNGLLKDISSKNGAERIQEIKSISKSQSNPLFYDNNKFRKINNSVLQYKIAEESQEQANKINKDLKNGKISSSVEHVLEALPTKAMEAVASPIYATGSLMNLKLPTGTADQDLQDWKAISSKYDQTTGNIESGLVRSASNVSGTIGYMIPSILASAIAPETNLGRITQGVSVGGQSYIETLNDDASNKLQSALTGLGKGTASYAIEGIAGGNILGKGSLDDLAVKTIASKTSNEASKKIASMVYEVGGEVFEEELENQVDYLVDKIVNDKGISLKEWLTEQNETVKSTIASTLVLKLLGLGGNTYKDVKEYEYNADTKKWINEAEKIIKKENLQFDIDKLKEKNNQAQNIINNNQNLQQNTTQNQFNSQGQQVMQVQDENTSKSNITGRNDTKNTTIKDFNESAKQYNIDYKNEDLKEIKQMFDKRGINAYFDENIFQSNNDAFSVWKPTYDEQGNISGREVVFNPKAQDTNTRVQELAIHELGHDLDLNEVQDMILKDASRKENWESARKSLENTYKHAYENDNIQISDENFNKIVDEEATMSILQRELGSQEYVNRLVNQNQSIAKKIYNWVIDKLNKFTGGKNEKIFWADIKNKFENAYNQEFNKNDNTAKFSIAGKKSLENIKNDSYSYSRGINSYNNAINLAKQNIDNEQIRQKTGWFQDKNGDWKYEFSDKDMSLKNIKIQKDKIYKLGDILEHDTLFTLYPEVENYKVEINDNIKANASFDRRNNTITINSKLIKNNKSLEGTLIHEIQHAIQNIENFERGTSTKGSKLKYYNSLGEIEATETKGRFLKEKYQNKNMFPIAPESSKANPQHKDLNKYLKNRNLLDKVKDSMYNYFNKRGVNNYDVSEEIVEKDRTQNNSLVDERRRLESENNSGSFNLPTNKKLEERVSGDKLLDTQDFINEIKDVGAEIDENGYVTVYHQTTKENANKIRKTGKMSAMEDGIFFSTSKNAQQSEGRGDVKLEFKIPAEKLELDDIFTNNADVKIPLKNKNQLLDVSDYLVISELKSENNSNIKNSNTIKEVDDISGTSLNRSSTSLSNNSLPLPQKNVNSQPLQKYSMQESENNSVSFSFEKNTKRYEDLLLSNTINYNKHNDGRLNIEMYSGKELINQFTVNSKDESIKQLGNDISNYIYENANENMQTLNLKQQDKSNYKPITHKEKQLDIIKKTNPMLDDYHAGIRNIEDIKTFEEAINDKESFSWGDYSKEDAERDLKRNKVQVYSSYNIKNGTFVSTSYIQALEYAGMDKSKVHSKEIKPSEVAWINGDEGQYANINQKYALPIKDWQQFLENNYQKEGTGKNLKEYNLPTKEDVKTKLNLPTKENINKQDNQTTQGEKIDWNEIERPEGKIRKHYRSIIESSNTTKEAKAIAKELMGTDTYVPETNKGQLAQADYRINNSSPEAELKSLMNRVIQGEKISSVDIAVGERLIQYYSKIGDKANLQDAIQTTAMAGTSAGQTVQALAMLNHQTPEGQATWIQRSVDKMNNELAKRKGGTITKDEEGNIKVVNKQGKDITDKVDLFELTPDMIDKIVSSKNKTEMYDNIDQVYEDLGQQVPLSTMEKIDSWRYFSMLANPKTHIRNMVGNVAMGKTQRLKDKLAGGIEDIVGAINKDMERTKTLRPADNKTKEFAKNDVLNPDVQSMMELNENKYNPQSRLQNARKTFKNDALENTLGRLFNWNDKLLEAEDALGLKSAYKKALTDYLTANKIDVDNITDKQLSKARNYAVEQAKEATFHQANSLATWINQASTNNKIVKGAKDAILPFVKTPLNVAKTGIEYNPVGLLKTITYDTVKLRKGDITVNKYIDNLSKGLTGTGIAVLGYALADAGILKASGGDDDKKEKYDEALGKQTYSITIGERTYSLDWLSPVGIPLFVGAEANALRNSQQKEKNRISSDDDKKYNQTLKSLENLANAMSNSMSPMSEMSMISGLTSALSSYEKDKTSAVITNAVKSYVNQFVPTVLGQIARTTDDYERSTTSTKSSGLSKAIDQTKLQLMSKIPGLRQKLPTKEDIWGNEQKAEPNIPLRVVNNFVNPSTVKNINTSKVDEELDNLYNKTGESTILPSTIEKTYTINGQTYRMTNEEYSKYKKNYGQTSYKLLDDLINSNDYNKLSDEQKQKAIENIYSYAKEVNKVDYAKNNNETVKTSTLYDTLEELKQKGGNQSSYLNYIAKTKDITGEDSSKKKIEVLANSNYTDKTKEIIYKNTEGSKDKKIIVVDKLGLPINEYLKYKSQKFESDKDEDGETVKGSKNQKVYDYLNNIPDEDLSQDYKKVICKMSGINSYDKDIVNMINNNKKLTVNERTEILTNIGFKIDKQGRIQTSSVLPLVKYVK